MRAIFFTTLFTLLFCLNGQGQSCLPNGITFTTQEEIDNFSVNYPGCTVIEGDVVIGSTFPFSDITNLNGFSNVISIGRLDIQNVGISDLSGLEKLTSLKSLTIAGCQFFSSFNGLQNLTSLDDLAIIYNPALYYLNGLPNITSLKSLTISSLVITGLNDLQNITSLQNLVIYLPNLTSFNGIQNITSLDSLAISNIPLTDLSGLNHINPIGSLTISNCPMLTSLNGIQHLTSLNSLSISSPVLTGLNDLQNITSLKNMVISMPALTNFDGIQNITTLDSLSISNIPLTNLNGLSHINSLGSLTVSKCPNLTDLSGLDNVSSLSGSLIVSEDSLLLSLDGLQPINSVGGRFEVSKCPKLTGLGSFWISVVLRGSLWLTDNEMLADIGGLEAITSVGQDVWIVNNPKLTNLSGLENLQSIHQSLALANNGLTNLAALGNLTFIGKNLYITANPMLANLNGLNGISDVFGDLYISSNNSILNFSGLEQLDSIHSQVYIQSNQNLISMTGLGNLRYVGKHMDIYGNPSLTNLMGLDKLEYVNNLGIFSNPALLNLKGMESLKTIETDVYILSNPVLVNVEGLNGLKNVGWSFNIYNSDGLKSLNGLNNLTTVGKELVVSSNLLLNDISSLKNLSAIGGKMSISYNPQLADCAVFAVCNQLLNAPDLVEISNNAPGCNSPAEAEAECNSLPVSVEVFLDNNGNELPNDPSDSPIENIQVNFSGTAQMNLRPTNANGFVRFGFLETGDFLLKLPEAPDDEWKISEFRFYYISSTGKDSTHVFLLLKPLVPCPELTTTLGLPTNFRSCLVNSNVRAAARNTGTVLAEGVRLSVVMPPVLELVTSIPLVSGQNGDTLYFELGDLKPFETAAARLTVKTKCDTFLFAQTLCIEAFAAMDNPCPNTLPAHSEIKLSAKCVGDTIVRFSLKNIGDAPTQGLHEYKIIRNEAIQYSNAFNLAAQQSLSFDFPADSATWRMEATKFDDGTETAVALENCGGLTPGYITAFWLDEGPVDYDFDCRQVIGSYDPNLKSAVPTGVGWNHQIIANSPLQYTIDFQNTGTDTAFRVLLRDVLPQHLDLNTFRPSFSSHPCTWEISGNKLEVLFLPIALPDSNVNEPASHGFFSFDIDQKPNLPDGTYLQNTASIIFDFNPPIVTNTVWHTIGKLTVRVDEAQPHASLWRVWGNPVRDAATFRSEEFIAGEKKFELYDAAGRLLRSAQFSGQEFEFQRDLLPSGLYFFRIGDAQGRMFTGKIVVAD